MSRGLVETPVNLPDVSGARLAGKKRARAAKVYFAYVDETGLDEASPAMIMVGIVVNGQRLTRTQDELSKIMASIGGITTGHLKELKSKNLFRGNGVWGNVSGEKRRAVASKLCNWLCDRKHDLALAAIDKKQFANQPPQPSDLGKIWQAGACHIALQLQRANQSQPGNKGRTVLVFDDNKKEAANFADLVYSPPPWTDDYYNWSKKKPRLDQVIDTPFTVKSDHVKLVQIADVFAAIFRRYAELNDFGIMEEYADERTHYKQWVQTLSTRLLGSAHRWPKQTASNCAHWYRSVAPPSLLALKSH